ncbi:putative S-adenosylmethionine-dependent methyltransferase [bacterium HR27]|nr:putative S-adenosylmethionine-dependent methyltransferase [bacterium HR27]
MIRLPTTERVTPDSWALRVTFWQSLAAYRWACTHARGKRVLDVGCGEGYGAAELARTAQLVIAVDQDKKTLAAAQRRYPFENVLWLGGSADHLPVRDEAIDLLCCFQVLEHLRAPERFLQEAKRVLVPGGRLLLTTPNRYAVLSGTNPHHDAEFDAAHLSELVQSVFSASEILGVFASERVLTYRSHHRRLAERVLRLDPWGLYQRLPTRLRVQLHTAATFSIRWWTNRQQRALVAQIGVDDFQIRRGDLNEAIDLVVVAVRNASD